MQQLYNDVFNGFCLTQMKFSGKWKCCGLNMLFLVKGFLISWIGEQETLGIGSAHFD